MTNSNLKRYDYETRQADVTEAGSKTVYDILDRRHGSVPIATAYDHFHAERILKALNAQG